MTNYIAYLRQSTKKQAVQNLGISAQRTIIENYIQNKGVILKEFVETESGKKSNRPMLQQALALCKKTKSVLIVAKLDRLSRNVAFTSKLLESDVEIVFCDFPQANRLVLHVISAIAEYEAQLISVRTKQALRMKRDERGYKLGKQENLLNNLDKAIQNSVVTNKKKKKAATNPNNMRAVALIGRMVKDGLSLSQMAENLNEQGFVTSKGCKFQPVQVLRLIQRYIA